MKKVFNFSVILAVLAAALTFSSCSKDEDYKLTIKFDRSGKFESGDKVTGTVTSSKGLKSAAILKVTESGGETTVEQTTKFDQSSFVIDKKSNDEYSIDKSGLADGNYKLKVTDKDGNETTEPFKVGEDPIVVEYTTFTVMLGGPKSSEGSFLSIKDKAAYKSSATEAQLKNVEIVFDGTTFKSAKESVNATVNTNGLSATITKDSDGTFDFTTSTNFKGYIDVIEGSLSGESATIKVTVYVEK